MHAINNRNLCECTMFIVIVFSKQKNLLSVGPFANIYNELVQRIQPMFMILV